MGRLGKRFLAIVMVLLTASVAAGCQHEPQSGKEAIQLMHGWGGSSPIHESMRSIYAGFSRCAPEVNLNSIAAPLNSLIVEKADDMLAVNKMADIVSTNGIAQFLENALIKDKALDLMPYIKGDAEFKKNIDPSVFTAWVEKNGALYTVPDALEVVGYWYNKKIFLKAGIEGPPNTWRELWEDCAKISAWAKSAGKDVTPFALEQEQSVEYFLPAYIAGLSHAGLDFVSSQPDGFSSPVFLQGLNGLKQAYRYSRDTTSIEDARKAFRDGSVAIYFNGLWECEQFKAGAAEKDIAYANYPTEFGESLSFISPASGYVLCRSGDSKRQDASVKFLKYILSEKQQTRILLETGQVPCNPNISVEAAKEKRPLLCDALKEARKADIQLKSIGSVWDGNTIDILKSSVESIGKGLLSEEQLIDRLNN